MSARVELQDLELTGMVDEIAEVTRPAGWWTGNMVKYDTMIRLDPQPGLKPGMSAIVDIVLVSYTDVLKIPVAAIVEASDGYLCWVRHENQIEKRKIMLGDTNEEFTVVESGLAEGEQVVLNPVAHLEQAEREALKPRSQKETEAARGSEDKKTESKKGEKKPDTEKKPPSKAGKQTDSKIQTSFKTADRNDVPTRDRENFSDIDTNKDDKLSAAELVATTSTAKGQ